MKVLITGAAGFIGSKLASTLLTRGHDVVGLDNFLPDSYDKNIKVMNISKLDKHIYANRFKFHEFDLRADNFNVLDQDFDYIINQAAMPGLLQSWTNFNLYISCNLIGLQRLAEWACNSQIRGFIQASTSSVYGIKAESNEEAKTEPNSPYGVSKLAAEKLLLSYWNNFQLPVTILRYFSVYGPGQRPDMAYARIIDAIANMSPFVIYGDGKQSRTNTYVSDVVEATVLAMENSPPGSVYNIGGNQKVSLIQVIELIESLMQGKLIKRFEATRPGDQLHTASVCRKANLDLGWTPRTSIEDGLKSQIDWALQARSEL